MNPISLFFSSLRSALKKKSSVSGFKQNSDYIETDNKADFSLIFKPVKKYWRQGFVLVVITIIAGLMAYPAPLIYRYLVDKVILAKNMEMLPWAVLAVALVRILSQLLNTIMNYLGSLFNRNTVLFIREELTDRMLSLPQSFFDRNSPGYIMTRIESDIGGIGWLLSSSPLRIIENFIKLIGGLVLLFYLEWRAGFAAAVVMPFFIIISHFFSKRQYALATHHSEEYAKSGGSMEESISNINTVKALAEENNFKSRIMNHYHRLFHLGIEQHALNSFYQIIVNFFPQIARFLLLLFGGIWIIKGEWTLGSLLAAQAYIGFVFAPVQSLANANIHYQKSLASLKRLSQFYKITPEYNPGGREIKKLTGKVTFENLSFAYEAGRDVLKSISFTAAPGEKIALCGESGTGKSTLISLLMRFYLPSSGKILFDGIDAGEYDLKQLRRRIAYVSQQPELFTDTIAANIRLNNTAASDEEILQAIETAGLVKFIAERKDGINSMLEDKGANLSIGQKKRLIIARALVSESDIMIFDEPTAELDNETSHEILNKLNEAVKGKTLFVITHDPIVAEFCDKSLFIIKGHLKNFAPHNEMLKVSPEYRQLFQIGGK